MIWRDRSRAECATLADVFDVGLPAVVSLTEARDLDSRDELLELMDVALACSFVEYIVATKRWLDLDSGATDLKPIRKLAALANVSLGMVFDHDTGLVMVKGASMCWDYGCGTPKRVLSAKGPQGARVYFKEHHLIGPHDWILRTKAARGVAPGSTWHEFR